MNMTCPACKGAGFLPVYKPNRRAHTLEVARVCHVCDGTGTIRTTAAVQTHGYGGEHEVLLDDDQALRFALSKGDGTS